MANWVELEIEYSMGEKSVEELGREYEVSPASIEKRAIEHGWPCEGIHSLTVLRQRFVEEYMVDFNATAAGARAGFAKEKGRTILKVPEVQMAIHARMRDLRHRTNVTQDRIVAQMARIAFGDVGSLVDEKGNFKPLHELSEDERAMIEAIDVVEGKADGGNVLLQTKKYKLASKLAYLERLGKYKGLFNDKIEVEATVEHKDTTPNDVARRFAFILLSAAKQKTQPEAKPTSDKEQPK